MTTGAVNPIDYPQSWDVVLIGGQISPGTCTISDFKAKFEWDVKKGKGVQGATITFVGQPPKTGTLKFKLWTRQHFIDWETFRPLFKYDPTKKTVQAVDIYHPALADIGLTSVVCEGIGAIVHEGNQLYTCTVELLEYFPPPKAAALGTPTGSQSNSATTAATGAVGAQPDPIADAQQKEIAALLAQASQP